MESELVVLLVYGDDIVIMSGSTAALKNNKRAIMKDFKLMDLGALQFFLGIKFNRSINGSFMRGHNTSTLNEYWNDSESKTLSL